MRSGRKVLNLDYTAHHFNGFPVLLFTPLVRAAHRSRREACASEASDSSRRHHGDGEDHDRAGSAHALGDRAAFNKHATFDTLMTEPLDKTLVDLDIDVVIVEGGPTGGTRETAVRYRDHPRVRLVLEDSPRGKGHAVRAGLREATANQAGAQGLRGNWRGCGWPPSIPCGRSRREANGADALLRHRRRRLHRQQPGRPPARATATTSRPTTTSPPASASSSPSARGIRGFRLVEGDLLDLAALTAGRARATTSCSTSPPTPTSASAPSTRARISSRTRSRPSTCWRRCGPTASGGSPSRPPARSTASRTSSRRRRPRRSRCRRASTAPRSWPARG